MTTTPLTVLISSFIEPHLVDRIRAEAPGAEVIYEPDLLPQPRYKADHNGHPLQRSEAAEARWRSLLRRADILFDFDYTNDADLPDLAPNVRWIHASSAGIGQYVARRRYIERMPRTIFTTASGVHAQPLAEFCALALVSFSRGLSRMVTLQAERRWERYAGTDLLGRTLLIYGLGAIGRECARVARTLGLRVLGVRRTAPLSPSAETLRANHVDELHPPSSWRALLPRADFVLLVAPHTTETDRVLGGAELALLKRGAVIINIGRGALIDEAALVEALRAGRLGGAALDVFETEPLPESSPLWSMPNVLICPHSASTSDRENERLVDLFCDNLERYQRGEALRNVFDPGRMY